jgi:hypothetical protein
MFMEYIHGINNMRQKNPSIKFLEFLKLLTEKDSISKDEIKERLNIKESAFFTYLANARQFFSINFVGGIGGNAYYSIDKKSLMKYFNIKIK